MILDQLQLPSQQQSVNISAKLIASIKMLQYSAQELEQAVAQEVAENPALEVDEVGLCQRCGTNLSSGLCPRCEQYAGGAADGRDEIAGWDDYGDLRGSGTGDEDYDPLDFVRSGGTLHEYLLRQLGASVSNDDYPIVEYLIGSLDSHGYLTVSPEEVAETLSVSLERVESALSLLQSLEPPGIGARDLGECLLIQLRLFEARGEVCPLSAQLVTGYMRELGEHRFAEIARAVGATTPEVKRAWQFIRANLNPYPAHAFQSGDVPGQGLTVPGERSMVIRPDVVIRKTATGFEAEVVEMRRFNFGMSGIYRTLYQQSRTHHTRPDDLDEDGKQHVRHYVTRTRFFIACMRQRWETLSTISNALIYFQSEFLEKGIRYLKPLTRGQLADYVGLHESTVSRAAANKYVLLPEGRTVAFDDFFDASLAAKDYLRELIAGENVARPFSDEELADRLEEMGIHLARRTVAKYRESLGILPSRLRA
ncbi:MAG TPA: RNA polymerase factor sigma-54 [Ktedonobacterales bacterium]